MPLNLIQLTPGDLGLDYCFTNFQRLNVDIISRAKLTLLNGQVFYWNFGASTPGVDFRPWPWLNTNNGRVYWWNNQYGVWTAARPFSFGQFWRPGPGGAESDLWSMDGGDGGDPRQTLPGGAANPAYAAPTAISGASWMVDHSFDARTGLGFGTLPSGAAVAFSATGGNEQVTLSQTQMPNHVHSLIGNLSDPTNREQRVIVPTAGANPGFADTAANTGAAGGNPSSTPVPNATDPHDNMMPWVGMAWIIPTSRQFYIVNG